MARKDAKDFYRFCQSTNLVIFIHHLLCVRQLTCTVFFLCSCLWTHFKVALKVVVQRARGRERERGGRMGEAGGRREKRDHSCKLDSNKAPLMSPLGDWEERRESAMPTCSLDGC